MITISGEHTTAQIYAELLDGTAEQQIKILVNHPTFSKTVRIMPDAHAGAANSVIGFTMPLTDSIIPNTVGVDIGCGMIAAKFSINSESLDFADIDKKIRQQIPLGNSKGGINKNPMIDFKSEFPFDVASEKLYHFTKNFNKRYNKSFKTAEYNHHWFEKLCKRINAEQLRIEKSLMSLGGGNHFIEIGTNSRDLSLWLTVHTGSRQLGKLIADYHTRIAKKHCTQNKINVPKQMEYLDDKLMYDYFVDMIFAQTYASLNRTMIVELIVKILKTVIVDKIESVHNYIDFDDLIIRKGAIRSYKGERMIIPFNMADGILICEGKSNADWNYSAPHGAGRLLSRTQAKNILKLNEFQKIMNEKNVFSTSIDNSTLDESPMAYKDPKIIEKAIEPTAEIIFKLKPLYNLKAS